MTAMTTKARKQITNEAGIHEGDTVIVYTHGYRSMQPVHTALRSAQYAEVERVTRTQFVVNGIRYNNDGHTVQHDDGNLGRVDGDYVTRAVHHPNIKPFTLWEALRARIEAPGFPESRLTTHTFGWGPEEVRVHIEDGGTVRLRTEVIGHVIPVLTEISEDEAACQWQVLTEKQWHAGEPLSRHDTQVEAVEAIYAHHQAITAAADQHLRDRARQKDVVAGLRAKAERALPEYTLSAQELKDVLGYIDSRISPWQR